MVKRFSLRNGGKTLSKCRNAPSPHVINVKLRRIPREKQNTKQKGAELYAKA